VRIRLRGRKLGVFDAVAENQAARERLDALDLGRNEKRRLSGREWRGDLDERIQRVLLQAVETDAAFRHIFTFDDFVRVRWVANARTKTHANANIAPLVHRPPIAIDLPRGNVL